MKCILVSGANGFIGQALCNVLLVDGWNVRGAVRDSGSAAKLASEVKIEVIGAIGPTTDWTKALMGVDVVVHLAARAHVLKESSADPLAEFRLVNTAGTERLARMAAAAGVHRFVYVSSIGVNGDHTSIQPFKEGDTPRPAKPYAVSKWEAEQLLQTLGTMTGLDVVTVRPPLVYGAGAKGNMRSLMDFVYRGWPLPLKNIKNRRSFIGLTNLVDCLRLCASEPAATGQTFLMCDGSDISTPELIRTIAKKMRKKDHLFSMPPQFFSWASIVAPPLRSKLNQLTESLVIDNSKFRQLLHWTPHHSVDEDLGSMVEEYLRGKNQHG